MPKREPSDTHKHLRLRPLVLALHSILLSMWSGSAASLPIGGQVAAGQSNITTPTPRNMVIQQGTGKSVINWQSYNISRPEQVKYQQPSASSISLNRVQGAEPSGIYGKLTSNGQVFLVNPNGIVFGKTARVEVGGMFATTHDIRDSDFQAGRYTFNKIPGSKDAQVVNEGKLVSKSGGYIALIGSDVTNNGKINTPKGTTALAAGERVSLDLRGDGLVNVQVDLAAANKAKVDHKGVIEAPGGKVFLTAQAKDAALDTVLNVEGVVRATTISQHHGIIHLDGGDSGVTKVSGQLLATGNQDGQKGGDVQVLGQHVDLQPTAVVDASGQAGGGKVLVGGDYQGKVGTRTAETTIVHQGARIKADARNKGNGGQVVVWADKDTRYDGHISARGGKNSGNGGNAEISGKVNLAMADKVDLRAPKGKFGNLLLDPGSVSIQDGTGSNTGPNSFDDQFIIDQLGLGNLTIATSAATNGAAENISVAGNTNITWGQATTLSLQAGRSIALNPGVIIQNTNAEVTPFDAIVMSANQGATPVAGNFQGITVNGTRLQTSQGSIRLNGRGGDTGGFNFGVDVQGSTNITTSAGEINLTGIGGGNSSVGGNIGVFLRGGNLQTGSGNININGIAGNGTGGFSRGISLADTNQLSTTGGSINIVGRGGDGAGDVNEGIEFLNTSTLSAGGGRQYHPQRHGR
jgi:filamentous hemagglutinin family protein